MIGFMSFAELSKVIRESTSKIPRDIDSVVGIPRSGMIPAYMIGLNLNLPVMDLPSFLRGETPMHGQRPMPGEADAISGSGSILLVDDSCYSGFAMDTARSMITASGFTGRVITCVAIVDPSARESVDIFFREMPCPRIFEWNTFHKPSVVQFACMDLDGVLCDDPSERDNDDGQRYAKFIRNAPVRFRPTCKIGYIVSARLEKYRPQTEEWLAGNGFQYGQLHLMNLPTAAERRKSGCHTSYKASVYASLQASVFYESDASQAREIARLARKPVLCTDTMEMHLPGVTSWPIRDIVKWKLTRPIGMITETARTMLR